jgi:hypothetical protein
MAEAILVCGCTLASEASGRLSRKTRLNSTVGVVALMLAIAVLGAGTAFAQTPAVPAATVAGQPDDQSKLDPSDGEDKAKAQKPAAEAPQAAKPNAEAPNSDKPNAETPKAETPEAEVPRADKPNAEAPEADKPKAEKPNAEAPEADKPKADKPNAEAPKADKPGKPRGDKPNPEKSKPADPMPTTASPKPAQPEQAPAGATTAQPNEPGPEPQVDAAKPASPRPKAAPFDAASPVRHVSTTRRPAAERNGAAARRAARAAGREWSGTSSAGSGGDSADAFPVASGPAAVGPGRAPQLASARVAAGAPASLGHQPPRRLILGGPPRDNVLTPLLLAILYAAGVAYVMRREVRRALGFETRRPAPARRGARPRTTARGRERVAVTAALRPTEHSRRGRAGRTAAGAAELRPRAWQAHIEFGHARRSEPHVARSAERRAGRHDEGGRSADGRA